MFELIPGELKNDGAWVNVNNTSKIPMQANSCLSASVSNPETWSTFDDAVANVIVGGNDGIGYVFHDNGLVGIDIDIGFSEDGFPSDTAIDIIDHCQSYTELSRSGRGFHIILKGRIPFKGRNNNAGIEIYSDGRYFIMTGKRVMYSDVIENQEAIDYILANYFKIAKSPVPATTDRIYNPVYKKPEGNTIFIRPEYPPVSEGGRHINLVSLAGQLHSQGYDKTELYKELLHVNKTACKPPLPVKEIRQITESICRYERG